MGVMRGLGASGSPMALEVLLKFNDLAYETSTTENQNRAKAFKDSSALILVKRKYTLSPVVCWAEIARFDDPRAREVVLLRGTIGYLPPLSKEETARIANAYEALPRDWIRTTIDAWKRGQGGGGPIEDRQRRALSIQLTLFKDPDLREEFLRDARRSKGMPTYDGNVAAALGGLLPWARDNDQEVLALARELAAMRGVEFFTSRSLARQILAQQGDPLLLDLLVKDELMGAAHRLEPGPGLVTTSDRRSIGCVPGVSCQGSQVNLRLLLSRCVHVSCGGISCRCA